MDAKYDRQLPVRWAIFLLLILLPGFLLRHCLLAALRVLSLAGGAALLLCPVCRLLEKRVSRNLAAFLTVFLVSGIFLLAAILLLPKLAYLLPRLADRLPSLRRISSLAERIGIDHTQVQEWIRQAEQALFRHMEGMGQEILRLLSNAASFFALSAASAAIAFYLLSRREEWALRLEMCVPSRFREKALCAAEQIKRDVGMFLKGQMLIALCVGVLSALGLRLLGIPGGIGLGLLAGVFNVIPYLGPFLACVPVALSALEISFTRAVMALIVLICVQQIDGLVLSPRIMGASTGFSPAAVILALFASGASFGAPGMLLALPALILIRTCIRVFVEIRRN